MYCRYNFHFGPDWVIAGVRDELFFRFYFFNVVEQGIDNGISQIGVLTPSSSLGDSVWNFPIDITFKSTNIFGWPRIAVAVYGVDFFGRDVVRGYGSVLVPIQPGTNAPTLLLILLPLF